LLSQAKNSKGLSAVAKEYELEIEETGDISLNADISTLGLPYGLVLSAYGLEQGQISDVIESDDAFYIIELKSKTQPKPRPYDQARERAKDMLLAEKSFSLAREKAEEIMEMLSSPNADFNSIAENLGYEITKESNVSRKSSLEALGKAGDFADNVFTSGVNKVTGPVKTPSGWAIIRLDSITPFDEEKYLKEKSEFTAGLLEKKRTDAFNSWFADFKKKAGLKENI
jgi:peptidyl-prolyl cis-trans isomerase D